MNPYEAPSLPPDDRPADAGETPARGRWLVFVSVLASVLTFPVEADFRYMAFRHDDIRLFLMVKAVFLAMILGPLTLYIGMNGWRGLKAVRTRIAVIGVLVVLQLAMDIGVLAAWP